MVRTFTKKDYPKLCKWLTAHGMDSPPIEMLPPTGFIVDGVACGFAYMTDSPIAIFDCFVSNPKSKKEDREDAINDIILTLLEYVKHKEKRVVLCSTQIESMRRRVLGVGFNQVGRHYFFSKEL